MLKSKGTARSIKSLMNTYGIPQTLLSIREYGGPKVKGDQHLLIEDRFTYALNFNSGSEIIIPNSWYSIVAVVFAVATMLYTIYVGGYMLYFVIGHLRTNSLIAGKTKMKIVQVVLRLLHVD